MPRETQLAQEIIAPDEQEWTEKTTQALLDEIKARYTQPMKRDAHAKHHGVVRARVSIEPDLPQKLRVGLFAQPKTYDAWIRLSNFQDGRPDIAGDVRGFALKLMQVPGEKLLHGAEASTTHDFLLISEERFIANTARDFFHLTVAFQSGNFARLLLYFLLNLQWRPMLNFFNSGDKHPHLLSIAWSSVNAYLLGEGQAVRYAVRAVTPLRDEFLQMPEEPTPNYLGERLQATLQDKPFDLDFCVQVQTDPATMPVERVDVAWDAPLQKVASIRIPRQDFSGEGYAQFAEDIAYNPWRCLPEHRPLGQIARMRQFAYRTIAAFRRSQNGADPSEPTPDFRP